MIVSTGSSIEAPDTAAPAELHADAEETFGFHPAHSSPKVTNLSFLLEAAAKTDEAPLPAWFEITSFVVLLLILAIDLFLAYKRPHIPSTRESALWVSFYIVLALIFAGLML